MATVITFPIERCGPRSTNAAECRDRSATIIILPVVRIERYEDPALDRESSVASARKRRRRAPRRD